MNNYSNRFKARSRKIKLILLVVGVTTLLTGCNDLNSKFTCPLQPGVSCQSLDQVNMLVDQGKLGQTHSTVPAASANLSVKTTGSALWGWTDLSSENDIKQAPQRASEMVIRVWIAPYIDEQGNYYSETLVYHVIQPSHWSIEQPTSSVVQKGGNHA